MRWSAPYSFDFYSNWLKLSGYWGSNYDWGANHDWSTYKGSTHNYYYAMPTTKITTSDNRFRMLGIMGTDHHPVVRVSILPMRTSDRYV